MNSHVPLLALWGNKNMTPVTCPFAGFLPDPLACDDVPLEGGRVPQRRPAAHGDAVLQERLVQRRPA